MQALHDKKPFTSYWYYPEAGYKNCGCCQRETMHYLLRYRVFLGMKLPIIPTETHYYMVCSKCCHPLRLEGEGAVALVIEKVKKHRPVKYNKYSQLDGARYIEEDMVTVGTDAELSRMIKRHLDDMG